MLAFVRASATVSAATLPTPKVVVPFRTLASVADVTAGSADLISQVISRVGNPHDSVDDLQPRLDRAILWTAAFVPVHDRTPVRPAPATARLAALRQPAAEWLRWLLDNQIGRPSWTERVFQFSSL